MEEKEEYQEEEFIRRVEERSKGSSIIG